MAKRKVKIISGIASCSVLAVGLIVANIVFANQYGGSSASAGTTSSSSEGSSETKDADYCYQEGYNTCVDISKEGSVLLKNKDSVLPLSQGAKVTVLGAMSYNYVEGGTGSAGGKDDENTVMMNDALIEAGLDVNESAWSWLKSACGGSRGVSSADPAGVGWTSYTGIHEFPSATYTAGKSQIVTSGYTDYAIVTFSRSGSEGASPSMDIENKGTTLNRTYFQLSDNEIDLLKFTKANFSHTIVLLNSASPMECGFVDDTDYNVDACLWIGHPGEAGLTGMATVLSGRTNPSGCLVDTYDYDQSTNPTYWNTDDNRYTTGQTFYQYEEGIYVGYRYYETADAVGYFDSSDFKNVAWKNGKISTGYDGVVQYPFGYGLSYTNFSETIKSSSVNLEAHGTNSITVTVKNEGSKYSGKDVVELYADVPYQSDTVNFGIKGVGLEKSKVSLIGYVKTDILEPGASKDYTITFDTDEISSFDNFGQGCYVLEKGEYKFNLQNNAHDWGEVGSDNAVNDQVKKTLSQSIIYKDEPTSGAVSDAVYANKRASDKVTAVNSMNDVTAGDGCMLDGYLSRNDIAGGMTSIMQHQSDETANETPSEGITSALSVKNTETTSYVYQTYINGVKKSLTETIYCHGNNMMPFSSTLPDGSSLDSGKYKEQKWGQTYYVAEDGNGDPVSDSDGNFEVLTAAPSDGSSYHKLCANDMKNVSISNDTGAEIWNKLVEETTLSEAYELQGNSGWQIGSIASVGVVSQKTVDGPGEVANGTSNGATWFPCAVLIASTWNRDCAREYGVSYGDQAVLFGVGVAYAPAANTHRSPFGGRNFEYYSEDGFIAGESLGNAVSGIQSTGTGVMMKHFALNDGDTNRGGNTTWANEQAIREVYCRPYEIAIKDYGAKGVMGSLNRIGMSWFHYGMYVQMLRNEWGFEGNLITDGDGSDGDGYNNAQAMLSAEGSMLARGIYSNAASTEAAYGDASSTGYGQYCLHQIMKHRLYQYASSSSITAAPSSSIGTIIWVVTDVVLGVALLACGVSLILVPSLKKKRKDHAAE